MVVVSQQPPRRVQLPNGQTVSASQANALAQQQQRQVQMAGNAASSAQNATGNELALAQKQQQYYTQNGQQMQSQQGSVSSPFQPLNQLQGPTGEIDKNAVSRLISSGYSYQDALQKVQNNRPNVQQAFNGVDGNNRPEQRAFSGSGTNADQAAQSARNELINLGVNDPAVLAEAESKARQNVMNEQAASLSLQSAENTRQQQNLASDAAAGNASKKSAQVAQPVNTQALYDQAAVSSILGTLPNEQRALLEPAIQASLGAINQSQQTNASIYNDQLSTANANADTIDAHLNTVMNGYNRLYDQVDKLNTQTRDDQLAQIADQERVTQERLNWEQQKAERSLRKQEVKVHDERVAQAALMGGFGSLGVKNWIDESTVEFEQAIADIGTEYSLQKSEVAVKFTGLHNEVLNNYRATSIDAMREFQAKLETIGGQFATNKVARDNARFAAFEAYKKNEDGLRREAANEIRGLSNTIYDQVQAERAAAAKAAELEREWSYKLENQQWERSFQTQKYNQDLQLKMMDLEASGNKSASESFKQDLATRDRIINDISGRVKSDTFMGQYRDVRNYFDNLEVTWQKYAAGEADPVAADQALITMYNKMLDPTSVVRESEYARTEQLQGYLRDIEGILGRGIVGPGTKLTPETREGIYELSKAFETRYREKFNESAERYLTELQDRNRFLPAELRVGHDVLGLPDIPSTRQRSTFDENDAGYSTGQDNIGDAISSLGRVTQGFSTPIAERSKGGLYESSTVQAWGGQHKGIDVAMPEGTAIPSMSDGEVVEAGGSGGWGKTIMVKDKYGALHRYSHLSELGLKPGDKVKKGQIIAKSGNTGNSTGPHLDYRIKVNGSYVDPYSYTG